MNKKNTDTSNKTISINAFTTFKHQPHNLSAIIKSQYEGSYNNNYNSYAFCDKILANNNS